MRTVPVDFNARLDYHRIRLSGAACRAAQTLGIVSGDWFIATDGEVRVGAKLLEASDGLEAWIGWETAEDVPSEDEVRSPQVVDEARRRLMRLRADSDRDYRAILQTLPLLEATLPPGAADYMRSQAYVAFGYIDLAQAAAQSAADKNPGEPVWEFHRLEVLRKANIDHAVEAARSALSRQPVSAAVVAKCAHILSDWGRQRSNPEGVREALRTTENFEAIADSAAAPASVKVLVHMTRGLAFSWLGDTPSATDEMSKAIAADRTRPEAYLGRGIAAYPSPEAVDDLRKAISLRVISFWPAYFLAHHCVQLQDWPEAERLAHDALAFRPRPRIQAQLLQWLAIAEFEQDKRSLAVEHIRAAVQLGPDEPSLLANAAAMERATTQRDTPGSTRAEWRVEPRVPTPLLEEAVSA